MAGLEVAASIIAVVNLSAKVTLLCTQYSREVATAKSDIARLQGRINQLENTFSEVNRLLDGQHGAELKASQKLRNGVDACLSQVAAIEQKMKARRGRKTMSRLGFRALRWPFTSQEVDKIVLELRESEAMLTLALQVDTATTMQKVDLDLVLSKLPSAEGAAFDSFHNQHDARCHPNTRIDLLHDIGVWADDVNGKCIFWLCGMAGTGKSTISRTVAQAFADKGQLGASFFFKRGEGDRGRANRFFTTIASQIVRSVPQLTATVRAAIDATPDISEKQMKDQFERLLLEPLTTLEKHAADSIVIVIDALDECEHEKDIKTLLNLLSRAQTIQGIRFRIFVTSRPELAIRLGFKHISEDTHQDVFLKDIAKDVIDHDISAFLADELAQIRDNNSLDADWPGGMTCQKLVDTASPLFIFAATISRFIGDSKWDPQEQLEIVLKHSTRSQASKLDQTYLPVFDRLLTGCNGAETVTLLKEFRTIVGSIVILEEPLAPETLSKLISVSKKAIDRRLDSLHSVLDIPADPGQPIRLLHLSFRDFLLDPEKQEEFKFWVDERQAHTLIANHCFELLSKPGVLKQDICKLKSPGALQSEIDRVTLRKYLPAEAQYACQYWADHLTRSSNENLWNQAYDFFKVNSLYWVEAMSLMGRLLESLAAIELLQQMISSGEKAEFLTLLADVKRLVFTYRPTIEAAPLQIYCSGLIFAPEKSLIREIYQKEVPRWIAQGPQVQECWGALRLTLEGHRSIVNSVAFSPDGKRVVSGSDDKSVSLWDAKSGTLQSTFNAYSANVSSVVFSPDGEHLTLGSSDSTIELWDTDSDTLQSKVKSHSSWVNSVAFSPDGKRVVSGSSDNTIRLWDTEFGTLQLTLEGHSSSVNSVSFSPDGKQVASGSSDNTTRLWDTDSGTLCSILEGHNSTVNSVAFSPDGKRVVSGSSDNTIRLWDTEFGTLQSTLEGHSSSVNSVSFSPDGKQVASGSSDNTTRLWDTDSGTLQSTLDGQSSLVRSVAFSPDGKQVASGSGDFTIKLWDAESGTLQSTLESHSAWVDSVAFSPDGKQIASGSGDFTIKLWDAESGTLQSMLKGHSAHSDLVISMAFSPDGKQVASGSNDSTVKLWDTEFGTLQLTLEGHSSSIYSVTFSPDGKQVASGSNDNTTRLWDTKSGTLCSILEGHNSTVNSVAFSPDGKRVVSGSMDNTARLWDTKSGTLCSILEGHSSIVNSVAFSPDGKQVASGSGDKTVRLWDTDSGTLQSLLSHDCWVCSVAFSLDGKHVASGLSNNTVTLWDTKSGTLRSTFGSQSAYKAHANSVAFSPDGKQAASGSSDETVRLWDTDSGMLQSLFKVHTPLDQLSFSADGSRLNTDRGIIRLNPAKTKLQGLENDPDLFVSKQWVMLGSHRLLWLPTDYRATCVAVQGQRMLLGHGSGAVSHFCFDISRMDFLRDI